MFFKLEHKVLRKVSDSHISRNVKSWRGTKCLGSQLGAYAGIEKHVDSSLAPTDHGNLTNIARDAMPPSMLT